ncbi:MAG TPA: glycosyltransferase family 39 protein [Polyangiales bacterium]|nr:glycosyltransferase family 39 protein [Polyangiales bacterium]
MPNVPAQNTDSAAPRIRAAALLKRIAGAVRARHLPWLALLFVGALYARLALDSGVTWDEGVQREYGDHILAWYRTGFRDTTATKFFNLYLYGGLFEVTAQLIVHQLPRAWGEFEIRHVLNAVSAALGVAAVYLSAKELAGRRAGFVAAALLALTPTWIGHGFFNSKDSPFGTAAAFVLYTTIRIAMSGGLLGWRNAGIAGCALGAALAIRPGGMFLAFFPVLAAGIQWLRLARADGSTRQGVLRAALQTAGRLLCAFAIAWAIMIATWPWAQEQPFVRPFIATREASHFIWGGSVIFRGRSIPCDQLPWTYVPVWFAVTMPEMYYVAALCALAIAAARRPGAWWRELQRNWLNPRMLGFGFVVLFVLVPLVGIWVQRPVMYNGHRHTLFLFPPLALGAGLIIHRALSTPELPRLLRYAFASLLLLATAATVKTMVEIHPYEYAFFNRLAGGLRGGAKHYQADYWGEAYREGVGWVVDIAPLVPGKKPVTIDACHGRPQLQYYSALWPEAKGRVALSDKGETARYYIAFPTGECDRRGELVHVVERQGVPLMHVYERSVPKRKKKGKKR